MNSPPTPTLSIAENLTKVRGDIANAAREFGRNPEEIRLLAVSKTKPIENIREAVQCGQRAFGENYVQELLPKTAAEPDLEWHFIGHLQSNKVKSVVGRVRLIHSVDRMSLATEINKQAAQLNLKQSILVEINLANEASKSGLSLEESSSFIKFVSQLPHVKLCGVMALPPLLPHDEARLHFRRLAVSVERWREELPPEQRKSFCELSIGTSHDFRAAIAEGATLVRIGTAIFGERSF